MVNFFLFSFFVSWGKKRRCFQKVAGEQVVQEKLDLRETCPACDEVIEEGQEQSIIRGKAWHLHCFQAIKSQMAAKKTRESGTKKKKKKKIASGAKK
jgi:hypothetical protein